MSVTAATVDAPSATCCYSAACQLQQSGPVSPADHSNSLVKSCREATWTGMVYRNHALVLMAMGSCMTGSRQPNSTMYGPFGLDEAVPAVAKQHICLFVSSLPAGLCCFANMQPACEWLSECPGGI